jgi:REP element-mobilizing transposase RayT
MAYDPDKHHRRSIRLNGYDYRQEGAYCVTICTHNRACLFGEIIEAQTVLSDFGKIVEEEWLQTPVVRPYVDLDAFVVMPNHIHGIIVIADTPVGTQRRCVLPETEPPTNVRAGSLSAIVRSFKAVVTKRINLLRHTPNDPAWQGRIYDQIIRNERMLNALREYIVLNPARWAEDQENPYRIG